MSMVFYFENLKKRKDGNGKLHKFKKRGTRNFCKIY